MATDTLRDELHDEAKRLYIDANYSSRGHFKEAHSWSTWAFVLGLPLAMLGGLSAAGAAITALFTDYKFLTAGLALVAAVLASTRGFLRPEETAEAHGVKAARYLGLRNDAMFFLKIDLNSQLASDELVLRLRALRQSYNDLTLLAPQLVSPKHYAAAKAAIERGETNYESDPLWKELER